MGGNFDEKKLGEFLRGLTLEERIWLLRELLAGCWNGAEITASDAILAAERWFMDRALSPASPRIAESRQKFWAIFLFLRYGALRLEEIAGLSRGEINLESGILQVKGKRGRIVPLPLPVARRLARLPQWERLFSGKCPLACDPSQLRRLFRQCARDLRLDRALLSPRSLQALRKLELGKTGVHPYLVERFFYGPPAGQTCFINPDEILIRQVQKEKRMDSTLKTSARNVFKGLVTKITERGIQVDVCIKTPAGLEISAIITKTSLNSLGLTIGKPVTALVKAPWVKIAPLDKKTPASNEMNIYEAEIEGVNSDASAVEILLKLAGGALLCSVYSGEKPGVEPKAGEKVEVEISAYAVILLAA